MLNPEKRKEKTATSIFLFLVLKHLLEKYENTLILWIWFALLGSADREDKNTPEITENSPQKPHLEEKSGETEVVYGPNNLSEAGGLYYFNARWYDASLGRFVSEDPVKDGINWYVYCVNNPLRFIDPTGLYVQFEQDEEGTWHSYGRTHLGDFFGLERESLGEGYESLQELMIDTYNSDSGKIDFYLESGVQINDNEILSDRSLTPENLEKTIKYFHHNAFPEGATCMATTFATMGYLGLDIEPLTNAKWKLKHAGMMESQLYRMEEQGTGVGKIDREYAQMFAESEYYVLGIHWGHVATFIGDKTGDVASGGISTDNTKTNIGLHFNGNSGNVDMTSWFVYDRWKRYRKPSNIIYSNYNTD